MRIALAVATIISVLDSTAYAQCGWILWRKSTLVFEGRTIAQQTPEWAPQDGFDQLAACRGAATGSIKATIDVLREAKAVSSASVHPGDRSATISDTVGGEKRLWEVEFVCFPGGFDPRMPNR
jgi:hypothetical protein